jgi:hypothetical protein
MRGALEGMRATLNEVTVADESEADLEAGHARRFLATCQQGVFTLALDQAFIQTEAGVVWLGLVCRSTDFEACTDDFEQMVASVRVVAQEGDGRTPDTDRPSSDGDTELLGSAT